jgi:hypothetical protein
MEIPTQQQTQLHNGQNPTAMGAAYWAAMQQQMQPEVLPPPQSYPQQQYTQPPQYQPPYNPMGQQMAQILQSQDQVVTYLGTLNQAYNAQIEQQGQWNQYLDQGIKTNRNRTNEAITRANIALFAIGAIVLASAYFNFTKPAPTNVPTNKAAPTALSVTATQ